MNAQQLDGDARLAILEARIEELELANERLRVTAGPAVRTASPAPLTRRQVFRRTGVLTGAGLGALFAAAYPRRAVMATQGQPVLAGLPNSADGSTLVISPTISSAFRAHNNGSGRGLEAIANSGLALFATCTSNDSSSNVVEASTPGTGTAVIASSSGGRGGVLFGKKAQLRLLPTARASHPTSGAAGDFFVDKAKRLWFCRGGTNWVRMA